VAATHFVEDFGSPLGGRARWLLKENYCRNEVVRTCLLQRCVDGDGGEANSHGRQGQLPAVKGH